MKTEHTSKNILFFVESYHYKPNANGICAKILADELIRRSSHVTVLATKTFHRQCSSEKVDGVDVFYFSRSMGHRLLLLSDDLNGIAKKIILYLSKCFMYFGVILGAFVWPLRKPALIYKYYNKAKKLYKQKKIDVAVGIYFGIEEVLASILLKRKHPDIKLIIYTLDALTGRETPILFGSKVLAKRSIEKWEKYIYSKADTVCVMESHRAHYKQKKYDQIRNKIKYMDIPFMNIRKEISYSDKKNGKVKIVYTGNTSRITGSPGYLIKMLKYMPDLSLYLYGTQDEFVKQLIKESGLMNKQIYIFGRFDNKEIMKIQETADFLVSFGSANSCMVPCKIFEYMTALKPIISFYKSDKDAAYPYISRYPDSILIKEDEEAFEDNLLLLKNFIYNTKRKTITNEFLLEKYGANTPNFMVEEILS